MRADHLTFLVLAGALTLVVFAFGVLPGLLLPPLLPSAEQGRRALRGWRAGGVSNHHMGAPGALTAQERTTKAAIRWTAGILFWLALGGISLWLYLWVPVEAPPPLETPFVILDGDRFPLGGE